VTGLFGDKKLSNLDKRLLVRTCGPKKFGRLGELGGEIVEDYLRSRRRNCTRRRPQAIFNFFSGRGGLEWENGRKGRKRTGSRPACPYLLSVCVLSAILVPKH
jgi:hypothetical protein